MDNFVDTEPEEPTILSYDESIPYEEQVAPIPSDTPPSSALAGRISANRVYVPPQGIFSSGKRKREEEEAEVEAVDENEISDGVTRTNALVLKGSPISRLPTGRIFGYAKYFDLAPVALEWIDDTSCVLVFSSTSACQEAQTALASKARPDELEMELDDEGYVVAKPVPAPLWPPEERINRSLGVGEGLKGVIRMRVARVDDVKKRGARNKSEFYRKHGSEAGKDPANVVLRTERKYASDGVDEDEKRRKLDEELDDFLAEEDADVENGNGDGDHNTSTPSRMRADELDSNPKQSKRARTSLEDRLTNPPRSKMRADYLDGTGRSLFEHTSLLRAHADDLEFEGQGGREWDRQKEPDSHNGQPRRRRRGGKGRGPKGGTEKRVVTAQQLDDELDAFLNEK